MKKIIFTTALILATFFSYAQTTVNSYNVNDSVWEKVNSPYYITGQIDVPRGRTLKIEPGVKVIFKGNYGIGVAGFLDCKGTATDKIEFKGDSLAPGTHVLWGRLSIASGYGSSPFSPIYYFRLKYCIFKNSGGLYFSGVKLIYNLIENCEFYNNEMCYYSRGDSDSIVNCTFDNNKQVFNGSSFIVLNSIIKNNETINLGTRILEVRNSLIENNGFVNYGNVIFEIVNSELKDCKCSPLLSQTECSNLKIKLVYVDNNIIKNSSPLKHNYDLEIGTILSNSTVEGIRSVYGRNSTLQNSLTINNNIFKDNKIGLKLNGLNNASNTVTCNEFIDNEIGLKFSIGQLDVVKNNYFCNTTYDAVNTSSSPQNLTQNYFCSNNIESKIIDKDDSAHLGYINYNLYSNNLQTVVKVIAKDKSILTLQDTTLGIDTSCVSINYTFTIDLNTKDTICVKFGTSYTSMNPTIFHSNYPLGSISLTVSYPVNGPVNTNILGIYFEEYKATDPEGNIVTKTRYVLVNQNCGIDTFYIDLNTPDTVCVKLGTSYNFILPTVYHSSLPSSQISLVQTSSNVNINILGLYLETYEATASNGVKVYKTRYVRVSENCDSNTSVLNYLISPIKIYPNPCSTILNIESKFENISKIKIIDIYGKIINEFELIGVYKYEIDVMNLENGTYFISVEMDNKVQISKFIVNK